MLKRRLEKELATQQALDEKAHMQKAKQQHANLVRSVQEQCDKARARLSAETERVMTELTKDMEGQFEMLRLRFEAKQNHLQQVTCPFPAHVCNCVRSHPNLLTSAIIILLFSACKAIAKAHRVLSRPALAFRPWTWT